MNWENFISYLDQNNIIHNLKDNPPKRILWGIAPTGDIHIGYLPYVGILNILRKFGSNVICLIANYHAYLDSKKTDWEEIDSRTEHYKNFLCSYNLGDTIVESKDEYIKRLYIEGFFKFSYLLHAENLKEWAARTLRSYLDKNYKLSDYIYVGTQIFDVIYFDIDSVICGVDESGIYKFGLPFIKNVIGKDIHYIYFPMVPGIYKNEMHASDDFTNKITVTDQENIIKDKLKIYLKNCLVKKEEPKLIYMLEEFVFPLFSIEPRVEILNKLQNYTENEVEFIAKEVSNRLSALLEPTRRVMGVKNNGDNNSQ